MSRFIQLIKFYEFTSSSCKLPRYPGWVCTTQLKHGWLIYSLVCYMYCAAHIKLVATILTPLLLFFKIKHSKIHHEESHIVYEPTWWSFLYRFATVTGTCLHTLVQRKEKSDFSSQMNKVIKWANWLHNNKVFRPWHVISITSELLTVAEQ